MQLADERIEETSDYKYWEVAAKQRTIEALKTRNDDRKDRVIEARRKLLDYPVTINGKPAIVSGVKEDYATVRSLSAGECVISCAWTTVLTTIKRNEGRFVT